MVTEARLSQSLKAPLPTEMTEVGMVIEVNPF